MNSLGLLNSWLAVLVIVIGLYGVISRAHLLKRVIALGLFQTGVFLFYVSMGVIRGPNGGAGRAPIWSFDPETASKVGGPFESPLPHVLMLTAIVVSVSTLAVAVALILKIHEAYGTVEEDRIIAADREAERDPLAAEDAA